MDEMVEKALAGKVSYRAEIIKSHAPSDSKKTRPASYHYRKYITWPEAMDLIGQNHFKVDHPNDQWTNKEWHARTVDQIQNKESYYKHIRNRVEKKAQAVDQKIKSMVKDGSIKEIKDLSADHPTRKEFDDTVRFRSEVEDFMRSVGQNTTGLPVDE